jgi:hypothetical protein
MMAKPAMQIERMMMTLRLRGNNPPSYPVGDQL